MQKAVKVVEARCVKREELKRVSELVSEHIVRLHAIQEEEEEAVPIVRILMDLCHCTLAEHLDAAAGPLTYRPPSHLPSLASSFRSVEREKRS